MTRTWKNNDTDTQGRMTILFATCVVAAARVNIPLTASRDQPAGTPPDGLVCLYIVPCFLETRNEKTDEIIEQVSSNNLEIIWMRRR